MKKLMFAVALLSISATSFAAVYSSQDSKNDCTLYRAVNKDSAVQPQANESLVLKQDVYGLSFQDLSIDFDKREASVKVIANVVLGVNRQVGESKAIIPAEHKDFDNLINQTNRKVYLIEKICINRDNEIVYAKRAE